MGSKGAIGAEGAEDDEGAERAEGFERAEEDVGFEGAEEDEGAAICILLNGLGHHWNRLYGFMRLQSKMSEWMGEWSGYPLDCYDY